MYSHRHQTLHILSVLFLLINAGINIGMACTPPPECTPPSRYEMWIYDPANSGYHKHVVPATSEIVVNMMGSECSVKFKMVPTIRDSGTGLYFTWWPEIYYYGCPWYTCLFRGVNWSLDSSVHTDYYTHTSNSYGTYTSTGMHLGYFCDSCTQCPQTISGGSRSVTVTVRDQIEMLRQEYREFNLSVPNRSEFVSESTYQNPGHFPFSEIESNDGYYDYAIFTIAQHLENVRTAMNHSLTLNSAYRNPVHNYNEGGETDSLHQFGRAVDIALNDFNNDGAVNNIDKNLLIQAVQNEGGTAYDHYTNRVHFSW